MKCCSCGCCFGWNVFIRTAKRSTKSWQPFGQDFSLRAASTIGRKPQYLPTSFATVFGVVSSARVRPRRIGEALVVATNALLPADLRPDEMDAGAIRQRVAIIADLLINGLRLPKAQS